MDIYRGAPCQVSIPIGKVSQLYNIFRIAGGRKELSLYNTPTDLDIFEEILLICSPKLKCLSIETLNCLFELSNYHPF